MEEVKACRYLVTEELQSHRSRNSGHIFRTHSIFARFISRAQNIFIQTALVTKLRGFLIPRVLQMAYTYTLRSYRPSVLLYIPVRGMISSQSQVFPANLYIQEQISSGELLGKPHKTKHKEMFQFPTPKVLQRCLYRLNLFSQKLGATHNAQCLDREYAFVFIFLLWFYFQ